jgi:hypothetical protein
MQFWIGLPLLDPDIGGIRNLRDFLPYLFRHRPAILIVTIIILAVALRHTGAKLLGLFGALFLVEWFLMQPLLYPRFILLMLPVAFICAALLVQRLLDVRPGFETIARVVAVASIFVLAAAAPYVNRDSIEYAVTGDVARFHRYTWFYRVYDWINSNTPREARFLVIVSSGQTYYLERPYRRADPWISGVIDWPRTNTGAALDSVLVAGGYDFVIYDNRDWKDFPGGPDMMRAIDQAYRAGSLRTVRSFDEKLYTSRYQRTYRTASVHILKVRKLRAPLGGL